LIIPPKIKKIKKIIEDELLLNKINIKIGNFIGQGIESTVFEGFNQDENNKKVAIKYTKRGGNIKEQNILEKLGELMIKINTKEYSIIVIEYCGISLEKSLNCDIKVKKIFDDPKKALTLGLQAIYDFQKRGYSHNDIKFDNICVIRSEKGNKIKLKLMDYGESSKVCDYGIKINKDNFRKHLLKKDIYKADNFYNLFLEDVKVEDFNYLNNKANLFTSLYNRLFRYKFDSAYGNDIESYIWSLLSYYYEPDKDGDFYNYMSFQKDFKTWLKLRLNPNNIKIPILRNAMIEIRKDFNIKVPELCEKLKLKCEL